LSAPTLAGRRLLGEGRQAEVFEWDEGRVLRLMRDPGARALAEKEAVALRAAAVAGAPAPAAFEVVEVDGRPGLVMERLDGADLLMSLGARPWTVFSAARTLGRLHAELAEVEAPVGLPGLFEALRGKLESPLVPGEVCERALEALELLAAGDRLCHGDMHPGNVLMTSSGPRVIDWTNAAFGPPAADVARTLVILRAGYLPGNAPWVMRRVHRLGRKALEALYLRAYGRARSLDRELVERWLVVRAADRLAEGIDVERAWLLGFLAA
jgi:aminoglycoside phosphotransferase (APT) family kinase protein